MWWGSARTYDSKELDDQRPSILIWCSERPLWAAEVAAPMRKEWEVKCLVGIPELFRMIFRFFWNQCLEAGRFLSSINRGSWGEVIWDFLWRRKRTMD